MMKRQGECNLCGQCCGAEGSPNQTSPWPNKWPESVRHRSLKDFSEKWPFVVLLPFEEKGSHEIGPVSRSGIVIVEGLLYVFKWVKDKGLCKSQSSVECPFLVEWDGVCMSDEDTPERPCGLVATQYEHLFHDVCLPEPGETKTEKAVERWVKDHPACSFIWEPE